MCVARSILILAFWALGFSVIPGHSAVVAQSKYVNFSSDIPIISRSGLAILIDSEFDNFRCQFRPIVGLLQLGTNDNFVFGFSAGAKLSSDIDVTTTDANTIYCSLSARPAIPELFTYDRVYGTNRICRVKKNDGHGLVKVSTIASDEYGRREAAIELSGEVHNSEKLSLIQAPPVVAGSIHPSFSYGIDVSISHFLFWNSFYAVCCGQKVIPTYREVTETRAITTVSASREYELLAKCQNLAFRVIWREILPTESSRQGSTISSDDNLIFREVKSDRSPMTDLGKCRIWDKRSNHKKTFLHVTISSGEASIMGFNFDGGGRWRGSENVDLREGQR